MARKVANFNQTEITNTFTFWSETKQNQNSK
ncbi:hypothetical protein VPHK120G1_0019 [Vibrio phage K120 g1]